LFSASISIVENNKELPKTSNTIVATNKDMPGSGIALYNAKKTIIRKIVEMFFGKKENFKIIYSSRFFDLSLKVWEWEMGGQ
jgi:hypothetical protein